MDFSRYTKFFNYGYFLSKYEPKILKKLLQATEDSSDISQPLKAGKAQFVNEKFKNKLKTTRKSHSKNKDREKGIEPEI